MNILLNSLFYIILSSSSERTDLGPNGNVYVQSRFENYLEHGLVCAQPLKNAHRVIITGFGPFSGASQNFSSQVLYAWGAFHAPSSDQDVSTKTIEFSLNNKNYQLCLLSLSTQWDLAAAIIINEANTFQPDMILMSGIGSSGSVVFETIAGNTATSLYGYNSQGGPIAETSPINPHVLPQGTPDVLPLTWMAEELKLKSEPLVNAIGYSIKMDSPTTPSDNYICNSTRYVVAYAAHNNLVSLAGGFLQIHPYFFKTPLVGFIHYPSSTKPNGEPMDLWSQFLIQVVTSSLKTRTSH